MAATIETSTVAVAAASPPPAPSPCAASLASLWQALQSPPSTRAAHLGEALVMRSLLTPDLLAHALETQRQSLPHRLLGQMLVDAGAAAAHANGVRAPPLQTGPFGSVAH
ncbi:MAG TPA: hypothetical protein PK420_06990, partial [Rubrivivax sp.]|nr:hypothetical protein [Rubrivivax sp.]